MVQRSGRDSESGKWAALAATFSRAKDNGNKALWPTLLAYGSELFGDEPDEPGREEARLAYKAFRKEVAKNAGKSVILDEFGKPFNLN